MDLEDLPVSAEESSNSGNDNQQVVTSFENIIFYLSHIPHKYPEGLNVNQKRTLRKAAANFEFDDDKLYYVGKTRKRRLVVLSNETRRQVFNDCHSSPEGDHLGQKKTLDRIESLYFWRGIVRDVASWVHSCPECHLREERRMLGPSSKKMKVAEENGSLVTVDLSAISIGNPELLAAIEKAHAIIRLVQQNLHAVHENEQSILEGAQKAEEDIDEIWDDIISKFIKMVSAQKRIMKEQVQTHKERTLIPIRQARKQFEYRLRLAKKLLVDAEAAIKENTSTESVLSKSSSLLNAPEIVRCEDASPVYTVFTNGHTQQQLLSIVGQTGYVCPQSPYGISGTKQCPGALRLSFDVERLDELDKTREARERRFCPKELRVYYSAGTSCTPPTSHASENLVDFTLQSLSSTCYLNRLQPGTMYSIFLSHRDEGSPRWSPWGAPYIASTSILPYGWDAANGTWILSDDSSIATKILNTSTPPLYTSSAQFFPGCSLTFTVLDAPSSTTADGIALVQQWVEGGALCQEGALFLSASGQLFVDGKFYSQMLDPLKPGVSVTWECDTEVEIVGQASQLRIVLTTQGDTRVVRWNLRDHVTSLYFGAIFATQGTRIQIT